MLAASSLGATAFGATAFSATPLLRRRGRLRLIRLWARLFAENRCGRGWCGTHQRGCENPSGTPRHKTSFLRVADDCAYYDSGRAIVYPPLWSVLPVSEPLSHLNH
jgi:hypothetical protein